jgi:3-deoxy-D-manno-octulosonate 8-phosphate phosphatase (KDO 8-P phosphatase)
MDRMLHNKLKDTKLVLLDVDGVLTDGSIVYHDSGSETKVFNVKDGLGIRLLMQAGVRVGIVTGRSSEALSHRCRDLGIDLVYDNVRDKAVVFENICGESGVEPGQMAFVGDDLPDLPLMNRVGLSIAVGDAHEAVVQRADMVTDAGGGDGAVREVCESILKAKQLWQAALEGFL